MAWECGECRATEGGKQEGVRVDVVCHHCGKPLCQKHRILIVDDAFDPSAASSKSPQDLLLRLKSLGAAPSQPYKSGVPALPAGAARAADGDGPVGRQAYHCEMCKKAHHPRAVAVEA